MSEKDSFANEDDMIMTCQGSRDSAVGIATGYGLDDRGVGVPVPVVMLT
jgi:hypothetical protein